MDLLNIQDIISNIFSFLTSKERSLLCTVCKQWCTISIDISLRVSRLYKESPKDAISAYSMANMEISRDYTILAAIPRTLRPLIFTDYHAVVRIKYLPRDILTAAFHGGNIDIIELAKHYHDVKHFNNDYTQYDEYNEKPIDKCNIIQEHYIVGNYYDFDSRTIVSEVCAMARYVAKLQTNKLRREYIEWIRHTFSTTAEYFIGLECIIEEICKSCDIKLLSWIIYTYLTKDKVVDNVGVINYGLIESSFLGNIEIIDFVYNIVGNQKTYQYIHYSLTYALSSGKQDHIDWCIKKEFNNSGVRISALKYNELSIEYCIKHTTIPIFNHILEADINVIKCILKHYQDDNCNTVCKILKACSVVYNTSIVKYLLDTYVMNNTMYNINVIMQHVSYATCNYRHAHKMFNYLVDAGFIVDDRLLKYFENASFKLKKYLYTQYMLHQGLPSKTTKEDILSDICAIIQ